MEASRERRPLRERRSTTVGSSDRGAKDVPSIASATVDCGTVAIVEDFLNVVLKDLRPEGTSGARPTTFVLRVR